MATPFANLFTRLTRLVVRPPGNRSPAGRGKSAPPALIGGQWSGTSFIDSFKRERNPTANELMGELKNTAFTCATINAAVCAAFRPRLYVPTEPTLQAQARCYTKPIDARASSS